MGKPFPYARERVCKACGKDFTANHPQRRYCEDCAAGGRPGYKPHPYSQEHRCQRCGVSFHSDHPRRRFCPECHDVVRPTRRTAICVVCGSKFVTSRHAWARCPECMAEGDAVQPVVVLCHTCGKPTDGTYWCRECAAARMGEDATLPAPVAAVARAHVAPAAAKAAPVVKKRSGSSSGRRMCHTCGKPSNGQYWCDRCRAKMRAAEDF